MDQENGRTIKKRTRFALSNNEMFEITHINDMSDEEVVGIWYEKHEYDKIKNDIVPIVKRMMKGERIEETNELTIRGLEYRTRKGAIRRQHNKVESITAVLDEQDRQIEADINDPELLRQAYLEISVPCHREANDLGISDEIAAKEYHNEISPGNAGYESDATEASSASKQRKVRKTTSFTKMFKQTLRIRSKASAMSPSPSRSNSPVREALNGTH